MELATTHKAFFGKNSWRKTDSHFTEEYDTVVFPSIVPECSWTKASRHYQLVIHFLMWFLFSGPCFPPSLFLMHLVIGAFYFGPIIVSVTCPHLESSPWWPRVPQAGLLPTHGTRGRPQGHPHCIQTSCRYVEAEGRSGDSKLSGKELMDYPDISKPRILFKKQTEQTPLFFFLLLGFLMVQYTSSNVQSNQR